MGNKITRIDPSVVKRPAPYRGPRSSEDWNDTMDEIVRDLANLANKWNLKLVPLVSTIPDGTDDTGIDAFTNGLDGRTLYVDSSLTDESSVLRYFDTDNDRPLTINEALDNVYVYIDAAAAAVREDAVSLSSTLTDAQKAAIGIHIFDATQSSTSVSLDGKSESNRLNVTQLAKDIYGPSYALGSDGQADLTNSVFAMVDSLLEAHGGDWSGDITLLHSGITLTQANVTPSVTVNDSFVGATTNLQDDLNQIRTRIKGIAGGAAWTTAMPALYAGGADTLTELLNATAGTGTKTVTNPWGYEQDDIDNLGTTLDAIATFVGQGTHADSSPNYPYNNFVTDGNSLETAIGTLDDTIDWARDPTRWLSGEKFKRLETPMYNLSGLTVTHNMGAWPQVEIIQISPSPTISGHLPFVVNHTSLNAFELTLIDRNFPGGVVPSGMIGSGIVLCLW